MDELETLRERARRLAREKSYLELTIHLMNRLTAAGTLEDTVDQILSGTVENLGGTAAELYYYVDETIWRADLMGQRATITAIDDPLVLQALEAGKPINQPGDFAATLLKAPAFAKSWTWVVPLLVGEQPVGVIKVCEMHIGLSELDSMIGAFFNYVAMTLRNAIMGHSRLQQAYAALAAANERLELLVDERTSELEHSRAQLRLLLDSTAEGIFGIDLEGRCSFSNLAAAAMLGYRGEPDMLGRTLHQLLRHADEDGRPYDAGDCPLCQAILPPRRVAGVEMTYRRANGSLLPLECRSHPIVKDGGTVGAVVSFVDISERRAAAQRLQSTIDTLSETNAELERFAYVASHDLQEPVRTVVAFSQLLERRLAECLTTEDRELLDFIIAGANRMHALVRDLLTYSRLSYRHSPLQPVSLEQVVAAACENLRVMIEDRKADIVADDLPTVLGDATQLLELFQNLLANGIKFTLPNTAPVVRLTARREGDHWLIGVSDNGIGIDPDYHEHIFVIFQRLHTIDTYPGTGIGLAVCKRIVERHGGRIWVESQLGQGATFWLTLKAAEGSRGLQSPPP